MTPLSQQLEVILRRSGALTPQALQLSLSQAHVRNMSLWDLLVIERQVPEETLAEAFSEWLNLPRVRLNSIDIEARAVAAVPGRIARQHTCLPLFLKGKNLIVAMVNPLDGQALRDVAFASSRQVEPVVASRTEILTGIDEHYSGAEARSIEANGGKEEVVAAFTSEQDALDFDHTDSPSSGIAPAVELCSRIVLDAIRQQASDIHIEPGPDELRVRLRVDGVLRDYLRLPRWLSAALVSRIKILAKLDIAQQRRPQDGRLKVKTHDRGIDLRVSTLPTLFGEKVVLRLLGLASAPRLDALGLSAEEMALLDDVVTQPQGLILVTGPTGAGKSTTLYSMLTRRRSAEVNIVTIEDPIEYQVLGANQVQVDTKAGLTFASCLRATLRQDPDVIMVGEIRDAETAEIAFQAALTGHLVFSTLHTNGSVAAIERLLDLGVQPLLITAAVNLIVAQRLARRICANCRETYVPTADVLRKLQIEGNNHAFLRGKGCTACNQTGYAGRIGIFEILRLTSSLNALVSRRATGAELRTAATQTGTRLLLDDAFDKMREGLTTAEEVLRVIGMGRPDEHGSTNRLTTVRRTRSVLP